MSRLVLCQHADGSSQVEWGACGRDDQGTCLSGCPGSAYAADEDDPARPCTDTPLKDDRHIAKVAPRTVDQPTPIPAVVIAVWSLWTGDTASTGRPWSVAARGRPPDTLARLRTVVLLV